MASVRFTVVPYDDYLEHHGIKGQKWGQKNGPPYPLDPADHSAKEKKLNPKFAKAGQAIKNTIKKQLDYRADRFRNPRKLSEAELKERLEHAKMEAEYTRLMGRSTREDRRAARDRIRQKLADVLIVDGSKLVSNLTEAAAKTIFNVGEKACGTVLDMSKELTVEMVKAANQRVNTRANYDATHTPTDENGNSNESIARQNQRARRDKYHIIRNINDRRIYNRVESGNVSGNALDQERALRRALRYQERRTRVR